MIEESVRWRRYRLERQIALGKGNFKLAGKLQLIFLGVLIDFFQIYPICSQIAIYNF